MTPVGAAGPGANPPAASIVDAHRFEEAADAPPNDAPLRTSSRQPDQRQIPALPPTQHPESAKAELEEGRGGHRAAHATGVLPTDYADTLKLLNEARKAVFYEGEDPDLGGQSLEDIASSVESAVQQAEQVAAR